MRHVVSLPQWGKVAAERLTDEVLFSQSYFLLEHLIRLASSAPSPTGEGLGHHEIFINAQTYYDVKF